ncbi:MAG: nucleotidyltransferase domain-containing protein [Proteobacteria bacterium]|nr:nucleotidyltransferase domain-containing protein [Pseudomonadota bacterium]
MNSGELSLPSLPGCPQQAVLQRVAARLWQDTRVQAIWLGGSFANGNWDVESDLDLRILVSTESADALIKSPFADLLGVPILGEAQLNLDSYQLRHCLTGDGVFLDLSLVPTIQAMTPE